MKLFYHHNSHIERGFYYSLRNTSLRTCTLFVKYADEMAFRRWDFSPTSDKSV